MEKQKIDYESWRKNLVNKHFKTLAEAQHYVEKHRTKGKRLIIFITSNNDIFV